METKLTPYELAKQIRTAIAEKFADFDSWKPEEQRQDAFFTWKLRLAVSGVGDALGYDVRFGEKGKKNSEFLFDHCFLETALPFDQTKGYFPAESRLRRMILALESEWAHDRGEVLYDFTKLLVARASLKVMVYDRLLYLEDFETAIQTYADGMASDLYLLCGWNKTAFEFVLCDGAGETVAVD